MTNEEFREAERIDRERLTSGETIKSHKQKKKKKTSKKIYQDVSATCACSDKHFGTVYFSMIVSERWQSLSQSARNMYVVCRVQSQSDQGKNLLVYYVEKLGRKKENYLNDYFVLPSSHLKIYGIDRSNASRNLHELERAGFIDIEERAHVADADGKMNIYHFSDRWKDT